jgi:hypothetical protein
MTFDTGLTNSSDSFSLPYLIHISPALFLIMHRHRDESTSRALEEYYTICMIFRRVLARDWKEVDFTQRSVKLLA